MRIRDHLRVDVRWQRRLVRVMELSLVGMFFIGLDRGSTGIVVNTAVALAVTQLPPVLERDYDIPMDAGLTLWLTTAVFLHALGTVGIPGTGASFYRSLGWWDHLTHALSSSIVAAAGYATARALDEHSESVRFPPKFTFIFVLMLVLAFGVLWEVIEFALAEATPLLGVGTILTQYDLRDTMLDLVFNTLGAVVVAIWGTAHLTDVSGALAERITARNS